MLRSLAVISLRFLSQAATLAPQNLSPSRRTILRKGAVEVWQDYAKAHAEDLDGPVNLGNCLARLKRYPEAESAFEAAAKISGNRPDLQASLGLNI